MTRLSVTMREAEKRADECTALLHRLVTTESPTGNETANLAVADILEDALIRAGGQVERLPSPRLGAHLLARFAGSGNGDGRPLLVVGHMDTVHPLGTLEQFPYAVTDGRIQGPGVYDMKSGVAASIFALRLLAERSAGPKSDLSFLITCDEEWGSPTSRELIEAEARASRAALVVEPSVPGGGVKSRRKGVGAYVLSVAGKPAHAGIEPEAGASAVHEIARQICRIYDLADPAAGTTVSVGVISGGTTENVVAAAAKCTIDVRFWTLDEARRVDAALRASKPFDKRCKLTLDGGINRGALEKTPASNRLFQKARLLAGQLGFELGEGKTGGGSDGNLTSAVGCPTLDGLGPDGGGAHTLGEHILLNDLPRRVALMAALFETM